MFLFFIFGCVVGIGYGLITHLSLSVFLLVLVLCIFIFGYAFFVHDNRRRAILLCGFLVFGILCGMGRVFFSDAYRKSSLDRFANQKISVEGIIVDEPDVRESSTRLTVGLRNVIQGTTTIPVRENIIVSVPVYPEFSYGDKILLSVTLVSPSQIETDGRIFDYPGYLRARGVWYTSRFTQVKFISSGHGSSIKSGLFSIKHAFTQSVERVIPRPESDLLRGLLIGAKQSLGKNLLAEFNRAGVSHVVVLSGYNIAIVAESVLVMLSFLSASMAFFFGCIVIVLFTILSGGGASALRAAIMVLVALFVQKTNRTYSAGRAFIFAVTLMLVWNPLLLIFDPSFQLSVLATIGIIFVSPILAPYFTKITEKYGFREIVSSTIATQLIVLPLLIYKTGIFSLVSLPVNVLILGTIPLTMFVGFVTGVLGFISVYLSYIPALFTYVLLRYQLTVVHIGATMPFGVIVLPSFSLSIVVVIYTIIFCGLYFLHKENS